MMKKLLLLIFGGMFFFSCSTQDQDDKEVVEEASVIHQRITNDGNKHQAFTDLVFFDNQFFLAFRESDSHVYGLNGIIKLMNSSDGTNWKLIKQFSVSEIDLRDPKFSVNMGKLMLYIHGSTYQGKSIASFRDFRVDYTDKWDNIQEVILDNKLSTSLNISGNEAWPWRIIWYNNIAYTIGYNGVDIFGIYKSTDGLFFEGQKKVTDISNGPTEATIRVTDKGQFYILARRNYGTTLLQTYDTTTNDLKLIGELPLINFGGPNFLFLNEKQLLYSGGDNGKVVLGIYDLETKKSKNLLNFGYGDCSYPGMVIKDNKLWLSYYSSSETDKGASIYIAKIKLDSLNVK